MNELTQSIMILSFIVYLVVVLGAAQYYTVYGQNQSQNQNQSISKYGINNITKSIGGIQCDKIEHLVFHNHTKLSYKNTKQDPEYSWRIRNYPKQLHFLVTHA